VQRELLRKIILNKINYFKMTKAKMYCPETLGTFKMMFGFAQPLKYIKDSSYKFKKINNERKKKIQDHQMGLKTTD
jgi:hypothetical protein